VQTQQLTDTAYEQLVANAQVIKLRRGKPAILLTPQKEIVKHIYRRSWFSSSRIWPYAERFIRSAALLGQRGILAPTIKGRYFYPKERCDILVYTYLEGKSLLTLARENNYAYLEKAPQFLGKLHDLGIYFRDFHLDNIIIHNEEFALIDIASVKCSRHGRGLNLRYRAKNIVQIFAKNEDQDAYRVFGKDHFLSRYIESVKFSARKQKLFNYLINKYSAKKNSEFKQNTVHTTISEAVE
jgi:tRNA A-37 threonylcarbamoyl transferase component Bud32